jgi:hypothetical protein
LFAKSEVLLSDYINANRVGGHLEIVINQTFHIEELGLVTA